VPLQRPVHAVIGQRDHSTPDSIKARTTPHKIAATYARDAPDCRNFCQIKGPFLSVPAWCASDPDISDWGAATASDIPDSPEYDSLPKRSKVTGAASAERSRVWC